MSLQNHQEPPPVLETAAQKLAKCSAIAIRSLKELEKNNDFTKLAPDLKTEITRKLGEIIHLGNNLDQVIAAVLRKRILDLRKLVKTLDEKLEKSNVDKKISFTKEMLGVLYGETY